MCDTPLLARKLYEVNPETGKNKIKLINRIDLSYEQAKKIYGDRLVLLPCGHCPSCLKSYSYEWSVRLMAESLYHEKKCFITLTYDNKHLPRKKSFDKEGVFNGWSHPLVKRDFQLFMKRLRRAFPDTKISFFSCGEFGEVGGRPHFHAIIYGLDFSEDRRIISYNALHQPLYTSDKLSSIWQKGLVSVGEVTSDSCSYVARYSLKKQITGVKSGEFVLMSRKPGLGTRFFMDHKDELYETDRLYNSDFKSNKIPRFFDKLAESDPAVMISFQEAKDRRKVLSKGREYQDMIAFGFNHIEEAQVFNYARHLKSSHLLRRSL